MYEITGTTKLICLLGSPVAHSLSPQMHNEAFRLLNLDYRYLAFNVPREQLKSAVDGLTTLGARGFNLTMPHKTDMVELVHELTPAARLAHAVNTVICENGRLIGHTTDGIGYMQSIQAAGATIIGKDMVLLGAGGAATAICVQAALDGVKNIHMFKRKNASWNKTQEFVDTLNRETSCHVSLWDICDTKALQTHIASAALLTNATNVGMAPGEDSSLVPKSMLHPGLVVSDIIYNPRQTRLLADAKSVGCLTINGLYMLLYQGAASFQCWTGKEMPVSAIQKLYFS